MTDERTLSIYDRQSRDYAEMMDRDAERDPMIGRFIAMCPPGGRVLDLGCGAGHFAGRMAAAGLRVDALDASAAMVDRTARRPGVSARLGRFEDLDERSVYDGIWAYFSLLHARRRDLPGHLGRIAAALRPGGLVFLGMKRGSGSGRDRLGRYYEYYEREDLETLLSRAGLQPGDCWFGTSTGMAGHPEGWIAIAARG